MTGHSAVNGVTTVPTTVPALLALRAAEDPAAIALVADGQGELSYGEWLRRARATASSLENAGLRHGERVGLVFDSADWIQYAVGFCAVHLAGGVAVPLSAGRADDDLRHILSSCRAVTVLHGPASPPSPRLRAQVRWTSVVTDIPGVNRDGSPLPSVSPEPDDLAQILYTSGTTGLPKGVGASHANLAAGFVARLALRSLAHSTHALHAFPVGTNAGQTMLLNALTARPTVVSMARFDAERWCELLQELRVGTLFLVPAMAIELLRSGVLARADLSSVRLIGRTAAALPAAVAAALAAAIPHATLVNYYTSTEAAPAQTTMVFDPDRPAAVGRPARPGDIAVRTETGTDVLPGQTGTVWLRSPAAARCYIDDPVASASVFTDGWVRMGDIGYLDHDGYLHLVDRETDVIVTGAHKVSSLRVEDALSTERRSARSMAQATREAAAFVVAAGSPPVRALTLNVAPQRHIIALSIDHLRCDGWSVGILLREIALLYSAARSARQGDPSLLSPLTATADEAASWAQDQWDRNRAFWQRLLRTPVPDPAPLPGQHIRPGAYEGASYLFCAEPPLVNALRAVANASRSTLMRVTLAAWAAALHEQTGSTELAFMSPLTGRTRPEWEQVVGCLIQQPIIRVQVSSRATPADLLSHVGERVAEATQHQFFPLHEFIDQVAHPAYFFYEPWARLVFGLCIAVFSAAALRHRILARFDETTPDAEPDDLVGLGALRGSDQSPPVEPGR